MLHLLGQSSVSGAALQLVLQRNPNSHWRGLFVLQHTSKALI